MDPTLVALIGTALLLVGGGIGYLGDRWIKGQRHVEHAESLERTIRIKKLLETENMSLEEANALMKAFRQGSGSLAQAEAKALIERQVKAEAQSPEHTEKASMVADDGKVPFEETTVGMRMEVGMRLEALDGELRYLLAQLAHECSDTRAASLYDAQEAWEAFRLREADFQGLLWEGGTGAPLLGTARMVDLTEQRIQDIRLAIEEARL